VVEISLSDINLDNVFGDESKLLLEGHIDTPALYHKVRDD
jgi:hypothetical protein